MGWVSIFRRLSLLLLNWPTNLNEWIFCWCGVRLIYLRQLHTSFFRILGEFLRDCCSKVGKFSTGPHFFLTYWGRWEGYLGESYLPLKDGMFNVEKEGSCRLWLQLGHVAISSLLWRGTFSRIWICILSLILFWCASLTFIFDGLSSVGVKRFQIDECFGEVLNAIQGQHLVFHAQTWPLRKTPTHCSQTRIPFGARQRFPYIKTETTFATLERNWRRL